MAGARTAAGRQAAAGTVKSVDGNTVVVTTANGDVKVQLAADVAVQKLASGAVGDIRPGLRIAASGETASDGTVTAHTVQLLPAAN